MSTDSSTTARKKRRTSATAGTEYRRIGAAPRPAERWSATRTAALEWQGASPVVTAYIAAQAFPITALRW